MAGGSGEIALDPLLPPAPAPVPKPEGPSVGVPDFEKGTGIPRFELSISGEIVGVRSFSFLLTRTNN